LDNFEANKQVTVELTDNMGRICRKEDLISEEPNHQLSTEGLANGLYFITVTSGKAKIVKKIVILR
jgi:hypothetical protein